MGPQITGQDPNVGQVLFSLWDHGEFGDAAWLPAMPLTEEVINHKQLGASMPGVASCNRNCNDCAVHTGAKADDGTTGTQCRVYIPAYQGQRVRMRLRRVVETMTMDAYGQSWSGSAWEVTVQDVGTGEHWLVGRQFVATEQGVNGQASQLKRMTAFYEFLGCTMCHAFYAKVSRAGPWVLEPAAVTLQGARSSYTNSRDAGFTCHDHTVYGRMLSDVHGQVYPSIAGEFTIESGIGVPAALGQGTWNKELFVCPAAGCATRQYENV